ncbi:hypothetical protein HanIR_Chr00c28g0911491 [Helianthus annuus]|nr:hypothetical protein HanIR_Chr00c28g0911491 [Helianthus annuus]
MLKTIIMHVEPIITHEHNHACTKSKITQEVKNPITHVIKLITHVIFSQRTQHTLSKLYNTLSLYIYQSVHMLN